MARPASDQPRLGVPVTVSTPKTQGPDKEPLGQYGEKSVSKAKSKWRIVRLVFSFVHFVKKAIHDRKISHVNLQLTARGRELNNAIATMIEAIESKNIQELVKCEKAFRKGLSKLCKIKKENADSSASMKVLEQWCEKNKNTERGESLRKLLNAPDSLLFERLVIGYNVSAYSADLGMTDEMKMRPISTLTILINAFQGTLWDGGEKCRLDDTIGEKYRELSVFKASPDYLQFIELLKHY